MPARFLDNVTTDIIHYENEKVCRRSIEITGCWSLLSSYTTRVISQLSLRSILKPSLTTHLRQLLLNSPSLRRDRWWVFAVILERFSNFLAARSLTLGGVRPVFTTLAVRCLCQGLSHFLAYQTFSLITVNDSRVGVIGPNGAGKSTLIKLLTVSTQPLFKNVVISLVF